MTANTSLFPELSVPKVAIYARYSSDNQRAASIEDQMLLCREAAEREGWKVEACYHDSAVSGASLIRPGIQKLMEAAMAGHFNIVVAEALDRLSRDQEDIAGLYKRLSFAGVRIITLSEGEINNLHIGLKGTMNALFLKDLADKTRRGLRGRVEQGKSGGGLTYGYDVVKKFDKKGEKLTGERKVNKKEAEVVIRIMTDYANGIPPLKIATALNEEKVPSPSGKGWGQSTINGNAKRGTGILNNELYIGRMVWNRLRYVKDPDTGKRISRLNPPEEHVIQEVPELRIVSDELWHKVKIRQHGLRLHQKPRKPYAFRDARRPKHMLSGLLRCGRCKGLYIGASLGYFGCSTRLNKGTCDNHHYVKYSRLEEVILEGLRSNLMKPDYFQEFCEAFTKEMNRLKQRESTQLSAHQRELHACCKSIDRLVDILKRGHESEAIMEELEYLEAHKKDLSRRVSQGKRPAPLLHPKMADVYHERLEALYSNLQEPETQIRAVEVLRSLIDHIELEPIDEVLHARIHGDFSNLYQFMQKQKALTSQGDKDLSLDLVAGAGFEPATFRL